MPAEHTNYEVEQVLRIPPAKQNCKPSDDNDDDRDSVEEPQNDVVGNARKYLTNGIHWLRSVLAFG